MRNRRESWRKVRESTKLINSIRERFADDTEVSQLCDDLIAARKKANNCPRCAKLRKLSKKYYLRRKAREADGEPDGT